MVTSLRVLVVDDSEDDTALLLQALRRGAWEVTHERVDTSTMMRTAFDKHGWDLIISDYAMPQFDGLAALALAKERAGDVPFILISGVVSEEAAVQAMKAGADDYFSKKNFTRLVPAVERELRQADARREARLIERQLRSRATRLAQALQLAQVGTWHLDFNTNMAIWSDEAMRIIGFNTDQPAPAFDWLLACLSPPDRTILADLMQNPETKQFSLDFPMIRPDGAVQFINIRGDIIRNPTLTPIEAAGTITDIGERKLVDAELVRLNELLKVQNHRLWTLTKQAHSVMDEVSFNFRKPLAEIKNVCAIMAEGLAGPITPVQEKHLGSINRAVLALNEMKENSLNSRNLPTGPPR